MKRQGTLKNDKKPVKVESVSNPQKPLSRKKVEKQLRSGKLIVTCCGGIKPLPILPPPDEEE